MSRCTIHPGSPRGSVSASPSKSYTHRALVAAASLGCRLEIRNPLDAMDTRRTRRGLQAMGFRIRLGPASWTILRRSAPPTPSGSARIHAGESGTTLRFLSALAARERFRTRFDADRQLRSRPIEPLLESLRSLGAESRPLQPRGSIPFELHGPLRPGKVRLNASGSSQFTSALLLSLSGLPTASQLRIDGHQVSRPYASATVRVLSALGARVRRSGSSYTVGGRRRAGPPRAWTVPGDASSAAYLWTAAAIAGGDVTVRGISPQWPQADLRILDLLRASGVRIARTGGSVRAWGRARRPLDAELTDAPDLVPLVAVLAATIPGRSRIRGAAHAAAKESDRREGAGRLVRAMGASIESGSDRLVIDGTVSPRPLRLTGFDDHRLVLSAAVGALGAPGPSTVGRAEAVGKSYPRFWADLRALGIRVRRIS